MRLLRRSLFARISAVVLGMVLAAVLVPSAIILLSSRSLLRDSLHGSLRACAETGATAAASFLANSDHDGLTALVATLLHDSPMLSLVLVARANGEVFVCSDPDREGTVEPGLGAVAAEPRSIEGRGGDGRRLLVVQVPVRVSGETWGSFVVEGRLDALDRAATHWFWSVAWMVLALGALGGLGAAALARSVAAPAADLARISDLIAAGDLTQRSGYRAPDEIGRLAAAFDHMLDERQEAERQLAQARDEALESARLKSEFLANVSHEVRTPMNGILGHTELLLATPLSPDQRASLEQVNVAGEDLLELLNQILDLAKIEAGRLELSATPFCPRDQVQAVCAILQPKGGARGLFVRADVGPEVPEWVCGDGNRIRQVLMNLVYNGIKFTNDGGVVVELRHAPAGAGRVRLEWRVVDTGIGIPEDRRHLLFQPFTQLDGSLSRRQGGSGLGLAISRQSVAAMGGELRVESTVGVGSTFSFSLELDLHQASAPAGSTTGAPAAELPATLRILVAEDNPVNQRLITAMLSREGWRVEVVADGQQVVDRVQQQRFDLVLMDVQMPGMDGFAATRAIRAHEAATSQRTPIIAVTAHAMNGDQELCFAAGMDGYLSKPVRSAALLRAIQDALGPATLTATSGR